MGRSALSEQTVIGAFDVPQSLRSATLRIAPHVSYAVENSGSNPVHVAIALRG